MSNKGGRIGVRARVRVRVRGILGSIALTVHRFTRKNELKIVSSKAIFDDLLKTQSKDKIATSWV